MNKNTGAGGKYKKTRNESKVGRVNEFPYQIRTASCHQSLLSPPSINTTYGRGGRRLANNIKIVLRKSLICRGHSFVQ